MTAPGRSLRNDAPVSGLIDGVTVWNGTTELGPSTVRWEGDEIVAVDAASSSHPELSVIPGLIDTHVHLDTYSGSRVIDVTAWPLITPKEEQVFHAAHHAQMAARAGVTTLRDLAGSELQLAVSRIFEDGTMVGPRLRVSPAVGLTAGHGDLFTPPLYPFRPKTADSPDECRKLVREWARAGAHGIKLYTSGGILSMGDSVTWRNQTEAELLATVDEAHALGMLVAAHTHTAGGVDIALKIGADSIEHGTALDPRQFAQLVERNLPVSPTLITNDTISAGAPGIPEAASAKARPIIALRDDKMRAAAAAGVRFVLGTDANGHLVKWGQQWDELRLMADLFSWTAERTLRAGTSDAADAIGLPTLGHVSAGSPADLLVMRGRPWLETGDLAVKNVVAVVSRGRLIAGELPV